jgi:hypothetical protein
MAGVLGAQEIRLPGDPRPAPNSIAACLDRVAEQFGDRMRMPSYGWSSSREDFGSMGKLEPPSDSAEFAALKKQLAEAARMCTLPVSPETVPKTELRALLTAYMIAEEYGGVYRTVRKIVSLKAKLKAKSAELVEAVRLLADPSLEYAEKLTGELDKLGIAAAENRMVAHGALMAAYSDSTQRAERDAHFNKAMAASKQITAAAWDARVAWELSHIYESYAGSLWEQGKKTEAKALIKKGILQLKKFPNSVRDLEEVAANLSS